MKEQRISQRDYYCNKILPPRVTEAGYLIDFLKRIYAVIHHLNSFFLTGAVKTFEDNLVCFVVPNPFPSLDIHSSKAISTSSEELERFEEIDH